MKKIDEIKRKILPILKRYNVKRAGIFGSIARGEENEESDIDILVEIEGRMSLLDFAGLKIELEEALGKRVDLGEYSTIRPIIKEQILSEEIGNDKKYLNKVLNEIILFLEKQNEFQLTKYEINII